MLNSIGSGDNGGTTPKNGPHKAEKPSDMVDIAKFLDLVYGAKADARGMPGKIPDIKGPIYIPVSQSAAPSEDARLAAAKLSKAKPSDVRDRKDLDRLRKVLGVSDDEFRCLPQSQGAFEQYLRSTGYDDDFISTIIKNIDEVINNTGGQTTNESKAALFTGTALLVSINRKLFEGYQLVLKKLR